MVKKQNILFLLNCRKIEAIEGTASFRLSTVKLEDEMTVGEEKNEEDEDEPSNSTFVAVIIALSVLVLLLLGAGFVGWWFWIRPTEWKHIEETNSVENVRIERATQDVGTTGKGTEEMMERERPSLNLNGHTWTGGFGCGVIVRYWILIALRFFF